MLSQYITGNEERLTTSSTRREQIQLISVEVAVADRYSVSVDDRVVVYCFLDDHKRMTTEIDNIGARSDVVIYFASPVSI